MQSDVKEIFLNYKYLHNIFVWSGSKKENIFSWVESMNEKVYLAKSLILIVKTWRSMITWHCTHIFLFIQIWWSGFFNPSCIIIIHKWHFMILGDNNERTDNWQKLWGVDDHFDDFISSDTGIKFILKKRVLGTIQILTTYYQGVITVNYDNSLILCLKEMHHSYFCF